MSTAHGKKKRGGVAGAVRAARPKHEHPATRKAAGRGRNSGSGTTHVTRQPAAEPKTRSASEEPLKHTNESVGKRDFSAQKQDAEREGRHPTESGLSQSLLKLDSLLTDVQRGILELGSGAEGEQARVPRPRKPSNQIKALRKPTIPVRTESKRSRPSLSEQLRRVALAAGSALEGVSSIHASVRTPVEGSVVMECLPAAIGVGRLEG